jgi:SAM-dependent methyltransferase
VSGVLGDGVVQSTVLEDLSTAVRYRHWLASLAAPHLGSRPIEIGSGTGDYAQEWSSGVETFTCSEAEPNRLAALQARFEGRPDIEVVELVIPIEMEGDHSAVVAYNVLEHIPDDVEALKAMAGLVAPGGKVVVIVPAVPFAMSRFDVEIGHQRRYTKRSLAATLTTAGLVTERLHYVNAVGLIAWLVLIKLMRQRPRAGMALSAYDRFLVPVLMRMESRRHPPLGQSLFAVARNPT